MSLIERTFPHRVVCELAFLFLLIVTLTGCASIPVCERPTASAVEYEGEVYAIFDGANASKLIKMIDGLSAGTCRVEK